jgi:hypothetical protein
MCLCSYAVKKMFIELGKIKMDVDFQFLVFNFYFLIASLRAFVQFCLKPGI